MRTSDPRVLGCATATTSNRASGGGGMQSAPITADGVASGSFYLAASGSTDGSWLDQPFWRESRLPPQLAPQNRRSYWMARMRQMCTLCALTLSIITSGYLTLHARSLTSWSGTLSSAQPAPPVHLRHHISAFAETEFFTTAIAAGVTASIMVACNKSTLRCILARGVAYNRVGKRRLIWDGQNVNAHLVVKSFRMETLQKRGKVPPRAMCPWGYDGRKSSVPSCGDARSCPTPPQLQAGGSFPQACRASLSGSLQHQGSSPWYWATASDSSDARAQASQLGRTI